MHYSMPGAGRAALLASGNNEMRLIRLSITDRLNQSGLMAKHKFRNQEDFVLKSWVVCLLTVLSQLVI